MARRSLRGCGIAVLTTSELKNSSCQGRIFAVDCVNCGNVVLVSAVRERRVGFVKSSVQGHAVSLGEECLESVRKRGSRRGRRILRSGGGAGEAGAEGEENGRARDQHDGGGEKMGEEQ